MQKQLENKRKRRRGTHQSIDDKHLARLIIVLASCDNIPLLSLASVASRNSNRIEVGTEISRKEVDEQALTIGGLNKNRVRIMQNKLEQDEWGGGGSHKP